MMDIQDIVIIMEKVGQLSVKMRLLKALQGAGSDVSELKDRELLILELVGSRGEITVGEIRRHFPNLVPSTISADLKKLRTDLGFIKKKLGVKDERMHIVELSQKGCEKVKEIHQKRLQNYEPLIACFKENIIDFSGFANFLDLAIGKVNETLNGYGWSEE